MLRSPGDLLALPRHTCVQMVDPLFLSPSYLFLKICTPSEWWSDLSLLPEIGFMYLKHPSCMTFSIYWIIQTSISCRPDSTAGFTAQVVTFLLRCSQHEVVHFRRWSPSLTCDLQSPTCWPHTVCSDVGLRRVALRHVYVWTESLPPGRCTLAAEFGCLAPPIPASSPLLCCSVFAAL